MKTVLYFRSYSNFNASRKLAGVMCAAHEFGWNVQTIDTGRETTGETVGKLLELWHPVGIINESAAGTADLPLSTYGKTPVVFIDRNPQTYGRKCSCVFNDSSANVRMAAQELLSLNPACYAYVPWHESLFWCRERETAFRDLLRLHGKSLSRFPGKRDTGTDSYSIDELGAWLNRLPHPAGVLAANDYIGRQAEIRFRRAVGRSILDKIQRVRIEKAKSPLLSREQPNLTAIANFCGYATSSALYKTFIKETGMSPLSWRTQVGLK